jgi:MSHA biogenesis protein MshQ
MMRDHAMFYAPHRAIGACLLALACLLAPAAALADSPITLFKSFAGNVSFTGTQKTLRTKNNATDPCAIASGPVTLQLRGVPSGATILNAQLYWAGSTKTAPDYDVTFDGKALSALAARRYTSATVGYDYFGGAFDVTAQVVAKGNGDYTAADLTINNGSPYCGVEGVLGGFQLLVIYSNPTETFRVLNVYEGFQYIRNSAVTLTLANFKIPSPINNLTGKVGHITWEGDATLSGGGEILKYNNAEMVDALNPSGNQFNSVSNINNDQASYGIDFDAYTVASPVIQAGQTSARTDYQSGSDLVLMNAEVIAAPNVPAADRAISMTLAGTLAPSALVDYTISVSNNGPLAEGGPVTVVDVLPSTLIFASAGGNGWSCGVLGQKVTCSYSGTMAAGATLPPITLRVTVAAAAAGLVTNSATVGGQLFDYYDGNNTSTVSAQIGASPFTPSYVFTDSSCDNGIPFGTPGQCTKLNFSDPVRIADLNIATYLTYIVNGVPTALSASDSTIKVKFALSCYEPAQDAGVRATYAAASAALPLCARNGVLPAQNSAAWTALNDMVFEGGQASSKAAYNFHYADVGRVEFLVSDSSGRLGTSSPFVQKPVNLLLQAPSGNQSGLAASAGDGKFVSAGTPFSLTIKAMMGGLPQLPAPNFGKESTPVQINLLAQAAIDSATSVRFADMLVGLDVDAPMPLSGTFGAFSGGIATGNFVYADVGILALTASIAGGDYIGAGDVVANPLNVGRFVPDHFDTATKDITAGGVQPLKPGMICDPNGMVCPTNVVAMAYSGQPFDVQVFARSALDIAVANPYPSIKNYRGVFARGVTLAAFSAPGSTTTPNPPAAPTGSLLSVNGIAAAVFGNVISTPPPPPPSPPQIPGMGLGHPVYTFPRPFSPSAAYANNWVVPTMVYIRATETSLPNDGVTSLRSGAVEGGIAIVTGRLFVPNAYGSSQLPLLLQLGAQYYTQTTTGGAASAGYWRNNASDSVTAITPSTDLRYNSCAVACPSAYNATAVLQFSGGTGNARLLSGSAAAKSGATVNVVGPTWLPSSLGRVTFGVYRSPVIYLREVY